MSQVGNMSQNEQTQESQDEYINPEESLSIEESPENPDANPQDEDSHKKKERSPSQYLEPFLSELAQLSDAEAKLQKTIDFMQSSLSQHGIPHFKSFWEARNICVELFKENINPISRAALWTKYSELSKEARRLKEILDEQSAFAVEQIEIAIQALESDIINFEENLEKISLVEYPPVRALESKKSFYQNIQRQLNLLNSQASRINALRKELIRTEMRVRQKNKFFQRLSAAGDKVFPLRKDLIKEVSQQFIADVDAFIGSNFSEENIQDSLFYLREEIKALQSIAKVLTLNTHSFTHTRMRLSECWDKIKGFEKERKKHRAQQKVVFRHNVDLILEKIQEVRQAFEANELSTDDGQKKLSEINGSMRDVELGRDELKFLRDEIHKVRQPIMDKIKAEEQQRLDQEEARELLKKQKFLELKESLEALFKAAEQYDADQLIAERDNLIGRINAASLTKLEKQEFERLLKPLKDVISEKKEQAWMKLPDDDRLAIQQLREILKQRKERRQEVKNQIELSRKSSGSSSFDIAQAMNFNAQMNIEKERLEKINQGIKEIEQKIAELERKK